MRILHTSDWHIGRTFHGYAMLDATRNVLAEIPKLVLEHKVDVVIAAGDIFDTANPSGEAYQLLQDTMKAILTTGAKVIVTSGNHDSPRRLGFAGPFTAPAGLYLVTDPSAIEESITLEDEYGSVDFYALPFLEPQLVREEAWADPSIKSQADVLRMAMAPIRARATERKKQGSRSVVIAHTFAAGAESASSDSERPITIGTLDAVPVNVLSGVDYVALGHIHGAATLADGSIRYSGAPLHYSFKEAGKSRGGWLVVLEAEGLESVTWVDLPIPRPLIVLTDTFDALLHNQKYEQYQEHWVSANYTDKARQIDPINQLRNRFEWCAEVRHQPTELIESNESFAKRVKGLSDEEIFENFLYDVRNGDGQNQAEQDVIAAVIADRRAQGQTA
jgi:exonuclease SbcD